MVFAMPSVLWVASLPDGLYDPPPGPFRLLDDFPPAAWLHFANLALALSAVALTLGFRTRLVSLGIGLLLIAIVGFESCLGKIDHNRHLLFAIPLVLAWSGWGARYALDSGRGGPVRFWALTLLALVLGLFFLSSAIPKIVSGAWLDPGRHAVQRFVERLGSPVAGLLKPLEDSPLWELADLAAVGFELGFPIAILFGIRWTRIFCALAVLFHAANIVLLGISFPEQMIVYGAFVDWQGIPGARRLGSALDRAVRRLRQARRLAVILPGFAYFAFHTAIGSPLATAGGLSLPGRILYNLVPVAVALLFLGRQLRDAAHALRSRRS
jgi:uncharacterized membrane protein YphA (DoxX/SURF4 family)